MNIKEFWNGLLPNFESSRMVEDIEMQRDAINNSILPTVRKIEKIMAGVPFKSNVAHQIQGLLVSRMPYLRNRPLTFSLNAIFQQILENLVYMERQVPIMFSKEVTKESVTYRRGAFLQLLSASRFAVDFTSAILNYLLAAEAAERGGQAIEEGFLKPELARFDSQMSAYADVLTSLYIKHSEFATTLNSIPEIAFDPDKFDVAVQTIGARKLTPFNTGLISTTANPIYKLRMVFAEWQVKRYRAKKEERRMLELRCLALQEALAGKQDAQLQQQLEYQTGRLQSLNFEIMKFEEKYA